MSGENDFSRETAGIVGVGVSSLSAASEAMMNGSSIDSFICFICWLIEFRFVLILIDPFPLSLVAGCGVVHAHVS